MFKPVTFKPAFPSHLRHVPVAAGEDPTLAHEYARLAVTALWAVSLALWTHFQVMWLYSASGGWETALSSAIIQLNTSRIMWWVSFFPALAFALAWHAFSYRLFSGARRGLRHASERRAVAQVYWGLCLGISFFAFNFRLLAIQPFATSGFERQARLLADYFHGAADWVPGPPILELMAFTGVLATGFLGLQTWGLLPRRKGTRARFAGLVVALLLLSMAGPGFGLPRLRSASMSPLVDELDRASPVVRGLLLGDEEFRTEADLLLRTYFDTHDSSGNRLSYRQTVGEHLPGWPNFDERELQYLVCELCQLPKTKLWTLDGLPLRLHPEAPADPEPGLVLEVPRHPDVVRVYSPLRTDPFRVVPVDELERALGEADWLVLKIDVEVRMEAVHSLFRTLRDLGVRRIDLAVVSMNFGRVSTRLPLLSYDLSLAGEPYEPREREGLDNYIVVKKYIPPDGFVDPRPKCSTVSRWGDDWYDRFVLESPGALSATIRVEAKPSQRYGQFIGSLQGVWSAGVDTIQIAPNPADASAR